MRKITIAKKACVAVLFLLFHLNVFAQTAVSFTPRLAGGNVKIKGDIIYVGNSILGKTTTNPTFNGAGAVTNLATLTTEANASYTGAGNNDEK